jgi:hypothetical protein
MGPEAPWPDAGGPRPDTDELSAKDAGGSNAELVTRSSFLKLALLQVVTSSISVPGFVRCSHSCHMASARDLWLRGDLPKVQLIKPAPLPQSLSDEPLLPGPRYLENLFSRFLDRIPVDRRQDLDAWITHDLKGEISLGTVCSGTDSPVLVWDGFTKALAVFGIKLHVHHAFSAEKHVGKQRFLKRMYL